MTLDGQGTDSGDRMRSTQSSTTEDGLTSEMRSILSHPYNRRILLPLLGWETPIEGDELTARVVATDVETRRTENVGAVETRENGQSKT
ncbi:hypothetical protein [Natrinema gelatinilyticum]|uniref:hypothetical protein n=1 Tax=Natrinema gelatinilyticum TaxID=2961571 RepID=UPI0020C268AB|nr:hypothetical protein [Natrinema gelatinilyticum]